MYDVQTCLLMFYGLLFGSNLCSCVHVCKYVCMHAGIFLCTQIRANFLHFFNLALHTHKYTQAQCVCIYLLNRYASKKMQSAAIRVEMKVQYNTSNHSINECKQPCYSEQRREQGSLRFTQTVVLASVHEPERKQLSSL